MLKGEDMVVLLQLSGGVPDWTVRSLADDTDIARSVVQRALQRLEESGLVDARRRRVNVMRAEEFLIHGVQYVFPAKLEGETRGVPTAWAAEPLSAQIASSPSELPPVWPDPRVSTRGLALRPLHGAVPEAARRNPELRERLALVDALRLGGARVRGVAARLLASRLERSAA